jgi:hypothetical protein
MDKQGTFSSMATFELRLDTPTSIQNLVFLKEGMREAFQLVSRDMLQLVRQENTKIRYKLFDSLFNLVILFYFIIRMS